MYTVVCFHDDPPKTYSFYLMHNNFMHQKHSIIFYAFPNTMYAEKKKNGPPCTQTIIYIQYTYLHIVVKKSIMELSQDVVLLNSYGLIQIQMIILTLVYICNINMHITIITNSEQVMSQLEVFPSDSS